MSIQILHRKVADSTGNNLVVSGDWNDTHEISGGTPGKILGFDEDGLGTEIDPSIFYGAAPGQIEYAADLTALSEINPVVNKVAILGGDRHGVFLFDSSDLSSAVAADTLQGIYVAIDDDLTGASGAWVRRHSGQVNVRWFGAKGDGATNDHAAIQAALDYVDSIGGGEVLFPAIIPQVVTNYLVTSYLSVHPKTRIKGAGRSVTKITTSAVGGGGANEHENVRNGSVLVSDQPINGSTRVDIYVEDLGLAASNGANVGACYYDRGGTFWSLNRVRCDGGKYGVIMEQSELCDVFEGDFENQLAGGAGVWIVDGADLSPGAAGDWANRISICNSQFNQPATSYCIRSGGGANHAFVDNNYNGGLNSILIEGTTPVVVRGGQFESAAGPNIKLTGANYLTIEGGTYTQTAGNAAIDFTAGGGTLSLGGVPVFSGGGGTSPVIGAGNLFRLWLGAVANNTGSALYSGTPTNLYDTTAAAPIPSIAAGQQFVFHDAAGVDYESYEEHVSEAGVRWHQVVGKGGAGGWAGGYRVKVNFGGGALFDAFTISANGDGVTAAFTSVGTFNVSNPTAANAAYRVNGTKVIGPQGAAVADAPALTSVDATNAVAAPTQTEFNNFVAEFNKLRDDLEATRVQLNDALGKLRTHGLIAT